MPGLVLAAAFAAVIVLAILRVRLSLAMSIATLILLLTPGRAGLAVASRAAVAPGTLELVASVTLVTLLAGLLKHFELLEPMSTSLAGTLRSNRLAFALVPGILGCLSVPGGAAMSAPMVDGLGDGLGLGPERKAAANVLLRHAWFFVFPFNPGLILTAHLSGLGVPAIVAHQWPLTLLALVTAASLFLGRANHSPPAYGPWRREAVTFLVTASPIFLSTALYLGLGLPLPLALGAGVALTCLVAARRGTFRRSALAESVDWEMALATEVIMIFAALVQGASGLEHVIKAVSDVAPLGATVLVSALAGFLTANPVAALGIALPALLPLLPAGQSTVAYVCLIYGLAFQSYLISPLHMCLILTNRYFRVALGQAYRHLLLPVALNTAGVAVLFLLTR